MADCDNVSVGVGGGFNNEFQRLSSVLLPCPHNSSQVGISTKSPNLQPKKISALWKGFPPI